MQKPRENKPQTKGPGPKSDVCLFCVAVGFWLSRGCLLLNANTPDICVRVFFYGMRGEGFLFLISGGLGVEAVFARSYFRVRARSQPSATVRNCSQRGDTRVPLGFVAEANGSARAVFIGPVRELQGNCSFASSTCALAAQALCFRASVICVSGAVVLRCLAWQARKPLREWHFFALPHTRLILASLT